MDTLEIIRQLQADPALKAQLRAVLLSEEVLALPEKMDRVESQIGTLNKTTQQLATSIGDLGARKPKRLIVDLSLRRLRTLRATLGV
jgi:hypothetical protein